MGCSWHLLEKQRGKEKYFAGKYGIANDFCCTSTHFLTKNKARVCIYSTLKTNLAAKPKKIFIQQNPKKHDELN
jgi:hypothetical protein